MRILLDEGRDAFNDGQLFNPQEEMSGNSKPSHNVGVSRYNVERVYGE